MLFGHQDNAAQQGGAQAAPTGSASYDPAPAASQGVNPLAVDPDTGASLPVVPPDSPGPVDTPPAAHTAAAQDTPSVLDQPSAPGYGSQSPFSNDPAPTSPFGSDQAAGGVSAAPYHEHYDDPSAAVPASQSAEQDFSSQGAASLEPQPALEPEPTQPPRQFAQSFSDYAAADPTADMPAVDDLLGIKQQALSELGTLVSHLEQSPEEKFRTTMMLIQGTDNPTLLKEAYAAAQAIPDEKSRAQALLDVVNEINYFTQQTQSQDQTADAGQVG